MKPDSDEGRGDAGPAAGPGAEPDPGSSARLAVEELVVECLDRFEREGPSALDRLCQQHPEHAERLRRRVEALGAFGMLPQAGDELDVPRRLGDFDLEDEMGGGGMGIVYRARQRSLGRRVALKIVRPAELYFPGARERFRREVETVARMHHPGIVPIHAVGEEDDVPYFAMELVEGATLGQVVDELAGREPRKLSGRDLEHAVARLAGKDAVESSFFAGSWVDVVLRIGRDVAEALEHAHRRGVLHRDVKPSNVMVTPAGRVLLVDFGLAQTEGTQRVTRTGVPLGSLPYMAPEQLAAGRAPLDARSDVYSLGVTLYELLTLRLPYGGESATAIVESVLGARPPRARALNPAVSRDVEIVVETALCRDPRRRYASAEDLAADLKNLLANRPIQARRASVAQRTLLWARRKPAAALATLLALFVAVGGPALYAWQETRRFDEVEQKNVELEGALAQLEREKARAEHHFEQAFGAVSEVLRLTMAQELRDVPGLQEERLAVIDRALEVARDLESDRPDDVEVLRERARIERLQADVLKDMSRPAEALAAYRGHLAVYEQLLVEDPERVDFQWELAGCLHQIAAIESDQMRAADAARSIDRALAVMRRVVSAGPPNARHLSDLAQILLSKSGQLRHAGRTSVARALTEEALELRRELYLQRPDDARSAADLGFVWLELEGIEITEGRAAPAVEAARAACELFAQAHTTEPLVPWYEGTYLYAQVQLANALRADGRLAEAIPIYERARDGFRRVVERFPAITVLHENYATCLSQLGIAYWESGRAREALATTRAGVELVDGAVRERPDDLDLLVIAATCEANLANFTILSGGSLDASIELCERALARLDECVRRGGGGVELANRLENARYNLALGLRRTGSTRRARRSRRSRSSSSTWAGCARPRTCGTSGCSRCGAIAGTRRRTKRSRRSSGCSPTWSARSGPATTTGTS